MRRFSTTEAVMNEPVPAAAAHRSSPFISMPPAARLVLLMALMGYLLLLLLLNVFGSGSASAPVLLWLGLHISLICLPLLAWRQEWGWFHPLVFGAALGLLSLVRRFSTYTEGLQFHITLAGYSSEALMELEAFALALGVLGLVSYYAGFFLLPQPLGLPQLSRRPVSSRRVRYAALFVVGLSVAAFAVYMESQGGIVAHLVSWQVGRTRALAGQYYWMPIIQMGALACLVWITADPAALRSPLFWAASAGSLAIVWLQGGSRSSLLVFILIGLTSWMLRRGRVAYSGTVVAGLVGLFLLSVLGDLRRSVWDGDVDWSVLAESSPLEAITRFSSGELVERATSDNAAYVVYARVPQRVDLVYGSTYLAVLTVPVPRSLWPEKPYMVDALTGRMIYGVAWGRPIGAVAEAYWNFHVPGVIIVFLIWGLFHKWLVRLVTHYRDHPGVLLLYAITLWRFLGPEGPLLYTWLLSIIPVVLLLWFVGLLVPVRGSRRPRAVMPLAGVPSAVSR